MRSRHQTRPESTHREDNQNGHFEYFEISGLQPDPDPPGFTGLNVQTADCSTTVSTEPVLGNVPTTRGPPFRSYVFSDGSETNVV